MTSRRRRPDRRRPSPTLRRRNRPEAVRRGPQGALRSSRAVRDRLIRAGAEAPGGQDGDSPVHWHRKREQHPDPRSRPSLSLFAIMCHSCSRLRLPRFIGSRKRTSTRPVRPGSHFPEKEHFRLKIRCEIPANTSDGRPNLGRYFVDTFIMNRRSES